MTDKYEVLGE